jgi:integrase
LVDFVDMMMATGLRIGETSAITWPALDLDVGTVEVRGTVIRIRGKGLIIKGRRSSPRLSATCATLETPKPICETSTLGSSTRTSPRTRSGGPSPR